MMTEREAIDKTKEGLQFYYEEHLEVIVNAAEYRVVKRYILIDGLYMCPTCDCIHRRPHRFCPKCGQRCVAVPENKPRKGVKNG